MMIFIMAIYGYHLILLFPC